jgi:serine-type D-Ala-D-Ala carboxypeptidase/endopeptidase (penicillin-binding protein 4)
MLCRSDVGEPNVARIRLRRHLRTIVLTELALLTILAVPSALAETATVTLSASERIVDLGDQVQVSGSIAGDPGCTGGRAVTLQWQPADSAGFATVDHGTTAADGTFAFDQSQPHTGRYRAMFSENGTCLAATSNLVLVRVRELVDAALVSAPSGARSCVDIAVAVSPERPGQFVQLQRKRRDGWRFVERLTLDPASEARASPCFPSDDGRVVRLRVRWVAQDELNETSSSRVLGFEAATAAPRTARTTAPAPARWRDAIGNAIGDRAVSVAIGRNDEILYHHEALIPRRPASNEKLLLAMTMYETFGADFRIRTSVSATAGETGTVHNLWILGRGDPTVDRSTMGALAHDLVDAGITRVQGRIVGATDYFRRDWDAPGWDRDARDYVNRPTALTFEGNHDADPERQAAKALTRRLEDLGVHVDGRPASGDPPDGIETVAVERSASLQRLFTKMLRPSDNFMAETLGKRLGAKTRGLPGTIAKGAAAIRAWTDAHGTDFRLNDNSGLSYGNRVTADGIVRLLWFAEDQPWGHKLRAALPTGGQGTLVNRLRRVNVRAKTGTLDDVSALSGWVKTGRNAWTGFSILSQGLSKASASGIEDRIVQIIDRRL